MHKGLGKILQKKIWKINLYRWDIISSFAQFGTVTPEPRPLNLVLHLLLGTLSISNPFTSPKTKTIGEAQVKLICNFN